jgi:hypothetical protein
MSTAATWLSVWLIAGIPTWNGTWLEPPPMSQQTITGAKQQLPILPPPEYDYPFPGKLYISAENDFAQMIVGCNFPPETTRMIHGCAAVPGTYSRGIGFMRANECTILLAKRELVEQYYDYDETIRHERAHCLGWRHGDIVTAEDAKTQKPAWPRVAETPKADVAEKPSVEKKPRVAAKPVEKPERPARQAHMPQPPWPLVAVSTILSTPFYVVAALTGHLR